MPGMDESQRCKERGTACLDPSEAEQEGRPGVASWLKQESYVRDDERCVVSDRKL